MQVNSVRSLMVGKTPFGTNNDPGEGRMLYPETMLQIARLDDKTIRQLAYAKASHDVNDKKHKRISNALYYSIPLAAGLAAAVKNPKSMSDLMKTAKLLPKTDFSRYVRLNRFVNTAVSLTGAILAIDATFGLKKILDKKSSSMHEFSNNHPVLTALGTVGTAFLAIVGLGKGASKLSSKLLSKIPEKEIAKTTAEVAKKLNKSKVLNFVSKKLAKVPSGIKNFASGVLDYSPILLICSSIAHSFGHEKAKATEYQNNYRDIKTAQALVREGLAKAAEEV